MYTGWVTTGLNLNEKYWVVRVVAVIQVPWQYKNYFSVSLLHVTCFLCITQCPAFSPSSTKQIHKVTILS